MTHNGKRKCLTFAVICVLSFSAIILESHSGAVGATGNSLINQQPNSSSPVTEFLIPYANSGPNAIVSAPNHIFWYVEHNTGEIGEFNESSKTFNRFPIPETGAIHASLALDCLGRIWFTEQNKNSPSVWAFNA